MILSMVKMAIDMQWYYLIWLWFGGNPDYWCNAFAWFIDHLFVTFYHKISCSSMGQWVDDVVKFRVAIHAKMKTSPCQVEWLLLEDGNKLDMIKMDLDVFRVFGFLDDTCIYSVSRGRSSWWRRSCSSMDWCARCSPCFLFRLSQKVWLKISASAVTKWDIWECVGVFDGLYWYGDSEYVWVGSLSTGSDRMDTGDEHLTGIICWWDLSANPFDYWEGYK